MSKLYSNMMESISYEKLLPYIYSLYICLITMWLTLFLIIKIYFDDNFIVLFIHYYIVGMFIILYLFIKSLKMNFLVSFIFLVVWWRDILLHFYRFNIKKISSGLYRFMTLNISFFDGDDCIWVWEFLSVFTFWGGGFTF